MTGLSSPSDEVLVSQWSTLPCWSQGRSLWSDYLLLGRPRWRMAAPGRRIQMRRYAQPPWSWVGRTEGTASHAFEGLVPSAARVQGSRGPASREPRTLMPVNTPDRRTPCAPLLCKRAAHGPQARRERRLGLVRARECQQIRWLARLSHRQIRGERTRTKRCRARESWCVGVARTMYAPRRTPARQ